MSKIPSYVGSTFERLTVKSEPFLVQGKVRRRSFITVECSCDGKQIDISLSDFTAGKRKSCGCLKTEAPHMRTHDLSKTRIYHIWADMKKRCDNELHVYYHNYGGRGITYQSEWADFEAFFRDMSEGYSDELELDRSDNSKGYSKDNCRWTGRSINCHNRRKRKGSEVASIGVCMHGSKFRATLHKDGVTVYRNTFNTEQEAAKAYDDASEQIYGDRPNGTT